MARKKVGRVKAELNITSMLDVVLNLIMFFILITNFSAAELPQGVKPPDPDGSMAKDATEGNRVVVNLIPDGTTGNIASVRVGGANYQSADLDSIRTALEKEVMIAREVTVTLRADKDLRYDQVQPIMELIAGIRVKDADGHEVSVVKVNLVATVAH